MNMILRRGRATRSSKTGIDQLRRRVPADVTWLVGGPAEVRFTLWTEDPAKVAAVFRKEKVELEARWADVRVGRQGLNHEDGPCRGRPRQGGVWRIVRREGPDQAGPGRADATLPCLRTRAMAAHPRMR